MTTTPEKQTTAVAERPITKMKLVLADESVQEQFRNVLKENTGVFVASILDIYSSDKYLQECEPKAVIMECLKAATLNLPINKQLGFAYIIAYKRVPQFQMGYKGYIQLAMRTGQYRHINADVVLEGIKVHKDLLSGEVTFSGDPTSDKPQGYFAHFETLNGFRKTHYMTRKEIESHAKKYSKSYGAANSAWATDFDAMAIKTPLRLLLSKYGLMTTEMERAITSEYDAEEEVAAAITEYANSEVIDVAPGGIAPAPDPGF